MTTLSQLYMSDPYGILTIIYLFTSFHFILNKVENPPVVYKCSQMMTMDLLELLLIRN